MRGLMRVKSCLLFGGFWGFSGSGSGFRVSDVPECHGATHCGTELEQEQEP